MKFSAHALLFVSLAVSAEAFSVTGGQHASLRTKSASSVTSLYSTPQSDVEQLLAKAAQMRAEADRLSDELGKTRPAAAPVLPKKSAEEIKSLLPTILAEADVAKQAVQWQELKDSKSVTAFGSASLRTFPVSLSMLESRSGLTADTLGLVENEVDLDDFKYATLWVTGGATVFGIASLAFLPENIGAAFCYIFALIPILFLGIGSTAPGVIADAIAILKNVSKSSDSGAAVAANERICRHEAAHFCCGYWCGLPVSQYSVEDGLARVEFGVASQKYSNTEIAALAVTALAGLVGEAKKWDKAVGASEDLMLLDLVYRRSDQFIGAAAQQDITRWGALTGALLLKQNEANYEKVVEAFQRQAGIDECIAILES